MPRSIEEIQNDIAKVKAEIALKNKYMNGYSAPTSNRGWGAYFQGDRSVHQKALDEQTAWARALQQQEFQAAEAEENRRLQAAEAEANRKMQEKIAGMNKSSAAEDRREEAKLRLEKLLIAKSDAERVGGDTRQLDAEINHLMDKYGFENVATEPYDPRNNVDYVLAKHSEVGKDNDLASIDAAIKEVSKYQTPAAAKRLAELDKVRTARAKYEDALANEKDLVNAWNGGELSDGLVNLGYTTEHAGDYIRLLDKSGNRVRRIKINTGNSNNSGDDWPD